MPVRDLMAARRALRASVDPGARATARLYGDAAKQELGERGPVWSTDGAPDHNRALAKNTPYADWSARVGPGAPSAAHQARKCGL